jgi:hypothetical protein
MDAFERVDTLVILMAGEIRRLFFIDLTPRIRLALNPAIYNLCFYVHLIYMCT